MPVDEGLIVPNFEARDAQPVGVLPPGFHDEAPPASSEPTRARNMFDPEGKGPRQGMTFGENVAGSISAGTIEGALGEAETLRVARGGIPMPETSAMDQGSGFVPELTLERAEAVRQAARQSVFDQIAYDLSPVHVSPRSVAGTLLGGVLAPSNLFSFGGAAAASRLGLAAGSVGRSAVAVGTAAAATDLATQGIRTTSGAQDEFNIPEAILAPIAGGLLGAGGHVVGDAIGKGVGSVARFVQERAARREALGTNLPREALPGDAPRDTAVSQPVTEDTPGVTPRTAETQPAAARDTPPAAEDPTTPVSRAQADGRAPAGPPDTATEVTLPEQAVEGAPVASTAPETHEARGARLAAERERMLDRGADADGRTRDAFEAVSSATSPKNEDAAWAMRHVDDALKLGRQDIAEHIAEEAERRAVAAEAKARAAEAEAKSSPGKQYAADEERAQADYDRKSADALREKVPAGHTRESGTEPVRAAEGAKPAHDHLIGEPVPNLGVHRVTAPGMDPVQVAPVVVEARSLKTSSDVGFDASLQPRQRDRAASGEQIREIAANLEPERLGVSAEADRGAPIVGGDSMVESGNGRVLAIRRAYEQGGEAAERYRDWLGRQSVDVSGFDQPVLVRQRLTPLDPEARRGFTDAANRAVTLSMSAPERALADARLITPDSLGLIRNAGDLGAAANRDFVRSFVQALPQAERGALSTAEGGLSGEGLARVRNAVLARAYGDAPVLSRITEATADDVRSISNALTAAAPDWARMRADIETGRVRADVDLTAELLEAVTRTADLRGRGEKLDAHLAQQDAFDRLADPVEAWMRMFYDPRGRRAAGGPRIAEALRAYADEARKVTAEEGLALGLPEVTTRDLLTIAARRGDNDAGGSQGLLYRRGARDGAGRTDGGSEAQGSLLGEGRPGAGGSRDGIGAAGEGGARPPDLTHEAGVRAEAESIGNELFRRQPARDEPDQIRQGRPVEDQGTEPVPGDARPARLEELATRLAGDFEAILRTGRVAAGARGQYGTATGVSRVRSLSDLDTVIHEVGHSLQQSVQHGALFDPLLARHRVELAPLGAGTGATGDAEAFAEMFRLYATNRAYAAKEYPGATAELETTLRASLPSQAAALDTLRSDLDVIHRAPSGAIVGSDVITPKPDGLFRRMLRLFGSDYIGASDLDPRGTPYFTWRDALYTRLVSREHPVLKAQEALARLYRETTGKTLDLLPADDAYIRANLASFHRDAANAMLKRGVRPARGTETQGPSYWGAIETAIGKRWTDESWHEFGAYLTARRMVAEYERFAAGEIPNPPGKFSVADYAKAVRDLGDRNPTFVAGAEQIYGFLRNHEQRIFDLGLTTKAFHEAAQSRRDYVPAMRDMEDMGRGSVQGASGRDGTSVMKAFRGSQRSVLNPLESIFARVHDLERAAAFNETKVALARIAEQAGPGSGFIAELIPANKLSPVRVDVVDALRAAGNRANVDNLDLGALIHQAEGLLGDDVFTHIFKQEAIQPGAEPITFYYVNGERRALRLADGKFGQALYNGLNNLTEPERNVFVSVLQISQQVLRAGVTKSLGFVYRNPVRDQLTSPVTGGRRYIPFVSAIRGLLDIVQHGGDFERYLSFGGFGAGAIHDAVENSAFAARSPQAFREKAWWNPTRITGAVSHLAELSEAATRAGLMQSFTKQAEKLGFDPFNAAIYATYNANDYVNFRRGGADLAVMRRFVPFLGAAVQGTDKEARSLFGTLIRLEAKRVRGEELTTLERDRLSDSRAAWVKALTLGAVFGGGTAYLNAQNAEWFGAAPWRRHRGYNFFPAGPEGNWATMPKPFGFMRNISDTFEYGVEYLMRQDPTLLGKWGEALADAHTLPFTNPIVDTFYSVRSNYDAFRDRAIVPPSLQSLPASEQYNRYTSEIAKGIGEATGWSPMKVDYAAKNLGGGTAVDFLRNSNTLIHWLQGRPGGKEKTVWDLPLMRELVQNLAVGSEATDRFYKLVGDKVGSLEQFANAHAQKIRAGDRTGAEDTLRNGSDAQRAYATLRNLGFDGDDKLMHPLVLARAYNAVIGGVSRALGDNNLLPEGELDRRNLTVSRRDTQPIQVDGPTTEKLRNALDALSMVSARNALIAYGADGMQGVEWRDPAEFMDRIHMLSPDVARELRGRIAAKRLYDPDTIREAWPEVKARLLKDGEHADLSDLEPHRPKSGKRERKRAMADE